MIRRLLLRAALLAACAGAMLGCGDARWHTHTSHDSPTCVEKHRRWVPAIHAGKVFIPGRWDYHCHRRFPYAR